MAEKDKKVRVRFEWTFRNVPNIYVADNLISLTATEYKEFRDYIEDRFKDPDTTKRWYFKVGTHVLLGTELTSVTLRIVPWWKLIFG